jgi:hypothetical protein
MNGTLRLAVAFVLVFGTAVVFSLNYDNWITLPAARKLIAAQLRDSDSTRFRNDVLHPWGWLCGELNSKNAGGGYVGFRRFVSGGRPGDYYLEGEGEISPRELADDTRSMIAVLDEQAKLTREYIELRRSNPTFPVPPEYEIRRQAHARYLKSSFDAQWRDHCL